MSWSTGYWNNSANPQAFGKVYCLKKISDGNIMFCWEGTRAGSWRFTSRLCLRWILNICLDKKDNLWTPSLQFYVCLFINIKTDAAKSGILSRWFHKLFNLVKTRRLHYPQCNLTTDARCTRHSINTWIAWQKTMLDVRAENWHQPWQLMVFLLVVMVDDNCCHIMVLPEIG